MSRAPKLTMHVAPHRDPRFCCGGSQKSGGLVIRGLCAGPYFLRVCDHVVLRASLRCRLFSHVYLVSSAVPVGVFCMEVKSVPLRIRSDPNAGPGQRSRPPAFVKSLRKWAGVANPEVGDPLRPVQRPRCCFCCWGGEPRKLRVS